MAGVLKYLNVELRLQAENFNNGIKAAQREASEFGKTIKPTTQLLNDFGKSATQFGKALTVGISAPIAAIAGVGLQFNAMQEQAHIAFTTMLGDGQKASAFLSELKDFAAKTPFEFPDLVRAAQRLMAMGFAANEVKPLVEAVGNRVAALGGGAAEIDRVTLALGQMQGRGRVATQEMNQLTEVGINAWEILAQKFNKAESEIRSMVEKGLVPADQAIKALIEDMGTRFPGALAKQSQSFSGLMSTIKDETRFVAGELTEGLFGVLKGPISKLADMLHNIRAEMEKWSDATKATIAVVGLIAAAIGPALYILGQMAFAINSIVQAALILKPALAVLGTIFAALTSPIGIVAVAIGAVTAAVGALLLGTERGRSLLKSAWDAISSTISSAADIIVRAYTTIRDNLVAVWNAHAGLGEKFGQLFDRIVGLTSRALDMMEQMWSRWGGAITTIAGKVFNVLVTGAIIELDRLLTTTEKALNAIGKVMDLLGIKARETNVAMGTMLGPPWALGLEMDALREKFVKTGSATNKFTLDLLSNKDAAKKTKDVYKEWVGEMDKFGSEYAETMGRMKQAGFDFHRELVSNTEAEVKAAEDANAKIAKDTIDRFKQIADAQRELSALSSIVIQGNAMEASRANEEAYDNIQAEVKAAMEAEKLHANTFQRAWETAVGNIASRFSDTIADMIVDWDFGWKGMLDILKDTAKSMLSAFISGFITPMLSQAAGLGGKLAESIFGGGKGGGGILGSVLGGGSGGSGGGGGGGGSQPGGLAGALSVAGSVGNILGGVDTVAGWIRSIGAGRRAADEIVKSQNAMWAAIVGLYEGRDTSSPRSLARTRASIDEVFGDWQEAVRAFAASDPNNQKVANQAFAELIPTITRLRADLDKELEAAGGMPGEAGGGVTLNQTVNVVFNVDGQDLNAQVVREQIMPEITTALETGVRSFREVWTRILGGNNGLSSTSVG